MDTADTVDTADNDILLLILLLVSYNKILWVMNIIIIRDWYMKKEPYF